MKWLGSRPGQPAFQLTVERGPGAPMTALDLLDPVDALEEGFALARKPETLNL